MPGNSTLFPVFTRLCFLGLTTQCELMDLIIPTNSGDFNVSAGLSHYVFNTLSPGEQLHSQRFWHMLLLLCSVMRPARTSSTVIGINQAAPGGCADLTLCSSPPGSADDDRPQGGASGELRRVRVRGAQSPVQRRQHPRRPLLLRAVPHSGAPSGAPQCSRLSRMHAELLAVPARRSDICLSAGD